jgi:hypothetical protein
VKNSEASRSHVCYAGLLCGSGLFCLAGVRNGAEILRAASKSFFVPRLSRIGRHSHEIIHYIAELLLYMSNHTWRVPCAGLAPDDRLAIEAARLEEIL